MQISELQAEGGASAKASHWELARHVKKNCKEDKAENEPGKKTKKLGQGSQVVCGLQVTVKTFGFYSM